MRLSAALFNLSEELDRLNVLRKKLQRQAAISPRSGKEDFPACSGVIRGAIIQVLGAASGPMPVRDINLAVEGSRYERLKDWQALGLGLRPMLRIFAFVLVAMCAALLMACGIEKSTSDAEQAISDHSHGKLSDPKCLHLVGDPDFQCGATLRSGRRVKVAVYFPEGSGESEGTTIIMWPCLSPRAKLGTIHRHSALRCGKLVAEYGG